MPSKLCVPKSALSESVSGSVMSDSLQHGLYSSWNPPGQNTGMGTFPSPGDLPNPGTEPRSPTLQVNSLPAEPQGKPKNTRMCSLSLLQWIFLTQELNQGLLHWQADSLPLNHLGSPFSNWYTSYFLLLPYCFDQGLHNMVNSRMSMDTIPVFLILGGKHSLHCEMKFHSESITFHC